MTPNLQCLLFLLVFGGLWLWLCKRAMSRQIDREMRRGNDSAE